MLVPKIPVGKIWMLVLAPALLATSPMLFGQQATTPAAPLWPGSARPSLGEPVSLELEARRALHLGLSSIAAELYRATLANPALTTEARNSIAVDLASAYLQQDRVADAKQALQKYVGLPTPTWSLRQAMIAVRERRFEDAKTASQSLNPDDPLLAERPGDRAWLFFVRGQLAEAARDPKAESFYQQAFEASSAAGLEAQHAWFMLARLRLRLQAGAVGEREIADLEKTIKNSRPGSAQVYLAISQLAVSYTATGRRPEAIDLLNNSLKSLPPQERVIADEWQLLLGVIAGAEEGPGRRALQDLLLSSNDRERQRVALLMLERASTAGARKDAFRATLDQLISANPPHPILEYLLLFRAQLAVASGPDKRYAQAEKDANTLLSQFPNSPLKAAAIGVLAEVMWEQGFYRRAASYAVNARAELKTGEARAQLGVLIAEAYFRAAEVGNSAPDYQTAADAYGAALSEVPAGVPPGNLMFQRVLSAINTGQLETAENILDGFAKDPRLDVTNRWQAEWNLARALQAAGNAQRAYARVGRLLEQSGAALGLSPDLRVSLAWLRARLALETNDPVRALSYAEDLSAELDGVAPALKEEVASNALLLQARAGFALKDDARTKTALEKLKKLRSDYPQSDAAAYSYLVEADAAEMEGRVVDAQKHVVDLADKFPKSAYAPYALYRAALYAERRGTDMQTYQDAYGKLEDLVKRYPDSDLVFYARLKQGNLLRSMNEYGRARTLYADLVNVFKFPQFADALSGELALADTEATLAASDPSRATDAASRYGRLYDLPAAPIDLRVEAGHKLGLYRLEKEGRDRAIAIWWPMIEEFVLRDEKATKLGANGRYWMSRTILRLAALQEAQDESSGPRGARRLYELVLEKGLPGAGIATEGLSRTGGKLPPTSPAR